MMKDYIEAYLQSPTEHVRRAAQL